jgi:RecA-family ATPase
MSEPILRLNTEQREQLISQALSYARQGIPVVPCKIVQLGNGKLSKYPPIAGGFCVENLTTDEDKIKKLFSTQNIIAIGTLPSVCGFNVIDIDVKEDGRGAGELLSELRERFDTPDTLLAQTISNGWHLFYKNPEPVIGGVRFFGKDLPIDLLPHNGKSGMILPDFINYFFVDNDEAYTNMSGAMTILPESIRRMGSENKSQIIRPEHDRYRGDIPLCEEMREAIIEAFKYLDFSNRDLWVNSGHAIKTLDSDEAKVLWLDWSSQYSGFDLRYAEEKWKTFRPSKIEIASLFHISKMHAEEIGESFKVKDIDKTIKEQKISEPEYKFLFNYKTFSDVFAPRPQREWLIEDLIIDKSVTVLCADGGSGKTFSVLDIAICVLTGENWCGRKVEKGAVLIIDEESGNDGLCDRLSRNIIGRGGNKDSDLPLHYISIEGVDFSDSSHIADIEYYIHKNKIKLVIVDALMDVSIGADENSVKDMNPIFTRMKHIIERDNTNFIVLHHTEKAGKNYRGSTALKGACDLMLLAEKTGDIVKYTSLKFRNGAPVNFKAKMLFSDVDFKMELYEGNDLVREFKDIDIKILKYLYIEKGQDGFKAESSEIKKYIKNLGGMLPSESKNFSQSVNNHLISLESKGLIKGEKSGDYSTAPIIYTIIGDFYDIKRIIEKGHNIKEEPE